MSDTIDVHESSVKNMPDDRPHGVAISEDGTLAEKIDDNNFPENVDSVDPFTRALVHTRNFAYNALTNNPKVNDIGVPIAVHIVSIAYFVGALVYHFNNEDATIDWCENVGLLIILEVIVYGTLIYYVVKKYYGDVLYKNIFRHVGAIAQILMARRWTRIVIYLLPIAAFLVFLGLDIKEGEEKRLISLLGVAFFMLFGFIFSKYPGHIQWRPVFCGLILQFVFGFLTIKWQTGRNIMSCVGGKVTTFQGYTVNGSSFVYGSLVTDPAFGKIFAFSTLSTIYFFVFVISILSYYGALQWFIKKLGWLMMWTMGTTVCESVNAAACIFLGMTESPLLYSSYIKDLTSSEIHAIMCGGWSTTAGSAMAAYIAYGVDPAHLIAATLMSAPASLCYAKLFWPESEVSRNTIDELVLTKEKASNVLDAACKGATGATRLVFGIIANLIAFLAFLAFFDALINWVGIQVGADELSFQYLMSKLFYPVSFLMGVDNESLEDVAMLVGVKTVVSEFQAYKIMLDLVEQRRLSKRTVAITTYALCGFSNLSSIGILVGSLSSLAPNQRKNITSVASRAFIAANIVCLLTACIAGIILKHGTEILCSYCMSCICQSIGIIHLMGYQTIFFYMDLQPDHGDMVLL